MQPLNAKFKLPQPDGTVREVAMEIPQKRGDEGMEIFDRFCRRYGPPPAPDPRFDAILADDLKRRNQDQKRNNKTKS